MPILKTYDPKLFSFGVISDVHIGYYTDNCNEDFERALNGFRNRGVTRINICGDSTSNGNTKQISDLKRIMAEFPEMTFRACNGNHDCKVESQTWYECFGTDLNNIEKINDDLYVHFSMLSSATYQCDAPYGEENINNLFSKIAGYDYRHAFLFLHFPIPNANMSTIGTAGLKPNRYYGFTQESTEPDKFLQMLRNQKNMTIFSGHSHFAHYVQSYYSSIIFYNEPEYNLHFIHVPSLTVPRDENMHYIERYNPSLQPSSGYVVDVYKDRIKVTGLEFNDEKEFRFGKENSSYNSCIILT